MSSKKRGAGSSRRDRRLVARGVRRPQPDLPKLTRALIKLAMTEAATEAAAEAEHARRSADAEKASDD